MIESSGRSRLLGLRRELDAARAGRELLDRKREVILRTVSERTPRAQGLRHTVATALAAARADLANAQIESGRTAVDAAALAQPRIVSVEATEMSVVGIMLPQIHAAVAPFRPRYGPVGTSGTLDRAGAAFTAILPSLLALASAEAAIRRLRRALTRTVRRLNALDMMVLPELSREIHVVAAALEEEERDEAVRRNRWCAAERCRRAVIPVSEALP
jgi:V/A-type H+-transporting ATPase subunit D